MNIVPYKPRQGMYARLGSGASVGVLLLFAAWRISVLLGGSPFRFMGLSVPHGTIWGAAFFVAAGAIAVLMLSGMRTGVGSVDSMTASCVDLLVDTENELQKVAWPGRDEIRRYTVVVIACILILGGLIYSVDMVVSYAMRGMQVLPV